VEAVREVRNLFGPQHLKDMLSLVGHHYSCTTAQEFRLRILVSQSRHIHSKRLKKLLSRAHDLSILLGATGSINALPILGCNLTPKTITQFRDISTNCEDMS